MGYPAAYVPVDRYSGSRAGSSEGARQPDPPSPCTGPVSFAVREEEVDIALQAIAVLKDRDQKLVEWMSEGLTTGEIAERLEISPNAAERARQRAIERFRKAYELLLRRRGES